MNSTKHFDAEQVKSAAVGRELEQLEYVAHIDRELLDGKPHPCPKCGGKDRFRLIDAKAGAVYCNQCFSSGNGDFLSAIMHFRGISFPQALEECGYRLGLTHSLGGNGNGNGRPRRNGTAPQAATPARKDDPSGLAFDQLNLQEETFVVRQYAGFWAKHKAGLQADQILRCRPKAGTWPCRAPQQHQQQVLVVPGFRPDDWTKQTAALLYRIDGQPFPAFGQLGERKVHLLKNSDDSLAVVGSVEEFLQADSVWLCAGLPDAIAISPFLPPGSIACTNTHGEGTFAEELVPAFTCKNVNLVMDTDETGEKGARIRAGKLYPVAQSVRVVALPINVMGEAGEQDRGLKDIRDLVVAGRGLDVINAAGRAEPMTQAPGDVASQEEAAEAPPFAKLIDTATLLGLDLRPRFLIRNVLVAGQPGVIGGRSKCLKTSIMLDMALSLATGTAFLGEYAAEGSSVAVFSAESGAATIRETFQRQAKARNIDPSEADIAWSFAVPKLSRGDHLAILAEVLKGKDVAFFDPFYLMALSIENASLASNVMGMGALLEPLGMIGQQTGCTIIVLHHFRKSGQPDQDEPAGLEELAQAGIAEWARQWCLLQRRTPYASDGRHELWMRAGGSAGHGGLYAVDVDEGILDPDTFAGRHWSVEVKQAGDVRQEVKRERETRKAEQAGEREADHRRRVLVAMGDHPDGATKRDIKTDCGLNTDNFARATRQLVKEMRIEEITVEKNGRKYEGFRLVKHRNGTAGTAGTE